MELRPGLLGVAAGLASLLAALLAVAARRGVLHTVMLDLRDRVHDFGVLKVIGRNSSGGGPAARRAGVPRLPVRFGRGGPAT